MNDELYNEYLRVLEWIKEAEHYRRIKAMKPFDEITQSMKKRCKEITEMSKKLKYKNEEN